MSFRFRQRELKSFLFFLFRLYELRKKKGKGKLHVNHSITNQLNVSYVKPLLTIRLVHKCLDIFSISIICKNRVTMQK